jgi:peroxiredoxin Q/BCP
MIDPPKATKGRRMSKKTRKNSPKTPVKKAARAPSKTSAKKPAAKTLKAAASKSGKSTAKAPKKPLAKPLAKTLAKPPAKTLPKSSATESHKAPSKPLKSDVPEQSGFVEGAKAPAFRLPRDGGATVQLSDFAGKKLVLFFYPRADTPGCTKEAIDFTRLSDAFAESGTAVVGVSADPLKAQESFRDKHELSVPLISDETHEMLEAYGAWGEKSMYGRTFQGIIRTTVLIGANGRIAKVWRNVRVDGHADEVLAAAQAL